MNEKAEVKAEEVTIKLTGETLKRVLEIKHKTEEETGKPISTVEVVRKIVSEK